MTEIAEYRFAANELLLWLCSCLADAKDPANAISKFRYNICATGGYGVAGCLHCSVYNACKRLEEVLVCRKPWACWMSTREEQNNEAL